jgi:phage shock protein E
MKKTWIGLAVLAIVVFLFVYTFGSPRLISAEEGKRRIASGEINLILDVRTFAEREVLGYYPGSVHIPAGSLATEFPKKFPMKNVSVLIYCNTGQRARAASDTLVSLGYPNVVYIAGSYTGLQ